MSSLFYIFFLSCFVRLYVVAPGVACFIFALVWALLSGSFESLFIKKKSHNKKNNALETFVILTSSPTTTDLEAAAVVEVVMN